VKICETRAAKVRVFAFAIHSVVPGPLVMGFAARYGSDDE
jgi:hypothetical protein